MWNLRARATSQKAWARVSPEVSVRAREIGGKGERSGETTSMATVLPLLCRKTSRPFTNLYKPLADKGLIWCLSAAGMGDIFVIFEP